MHRGAVAPLPCPPSLPPPLPSPLFFPPFEFPLTAFPTQQPITMPCVSGRGDLIGCAGGAWEVRAVFISHCVLLDSLQQHPQSAHTDSRRRKSRPRGGKGGKGGTNRREKGRPPVYTAFSAVVISCLRNRKCVMFSAGLKIHIDSGRHLQCCCCSAQFLLVL